LEEQIVQYRADLNAAQEALVRANKLRVQRTLSDEEVTEADRKVKVARAQVEQAQAQKKSRQTLGTQEAEAEVARRASALADARATLTLLEAGTRPEEIDAERARLTRLQEEVRALEEVRARLAVCSPVSGVMSTPRLKEKVNQYAKEGDLIALIEEPAGLEAEIALTEQEVARVEVGHVVHLKARALPYETFTARVKRIAPATKPGDVQGIVTVYCELEKGDTGLRPGMTGHARVFTGPRSVGMVLLDRALRYVRTEFWW
jgi:HlyD family secretion protein